MKLDSPLFDRIRVRPDEDRRIRRDSPICEWPGCSERASHRAPKGRDREREYWRLCLDHVREYNQSYNYFAGMSDEAVARYQKDAVTGHRPTWKMGSGGSGQFIYGTNDPFEMFREVGGPARAHTSRATEGRTVRNAERKALGVLGLDIEVGKAEIKAQFKMLVKRHHPDANGGDKSCEDKLREIIQAYNYLKSAGLC